MIKFNTSIHIRCIKNITIHCDDVAHIILIKFIFIFHD